MIMEATLLALGDILDPESPARRKRCERAVKAANDLICLRDIRRMMGLPAIPLSGG